jgi:hypothetical protein
MFHSSDRKRGFRMRAQVALLLLAAGCCHFEKVVVTLPDV